MKSTKTTSSIVLALIGAWALAGCGTTQPKVTTQPVTLNCKIPEITRLPESPESQEKGGIEIAVVPVTYRAVRHDTSSIQQVQPTSSEAFQIGFEKGTKGPQVVIVAATSSKLLPKPNRLELTVRINNKLSRVFRGQGSVVQFNVAGKLWPFGETDYGEFVNGIIPPRNELAGITIRGPYLRDMPEKGTLGIFLYDVPIIVDEAGNVKEKQNFEWYFSYTTKTVEETIEQQSPTRRLVTVAEYQQMLLKQQQEQALRSLPPGTRPQQ